MWDKTSRSGLWLPLWSAWSEPRWDLSTAGYWAAFECSRPLSVQIQSSQHRVDHSPPWRLTLAGAQELARPSARHPNHHSSSRWHRYPHSPAVPSEPPPRPPWRALRPAGGKLCRHAVCARQPRCQHKPCKRPTSASTSFIVFPPVPDPPSTPPLPIFRWVSKRF